MIRRRDKPDGLPYRVYERRGVRTYSIGYKMPSGAWAWRYDCPTGDVNQIATLRKKAIEESSRVAGDRLPGGFAALVDAWFEWQDKLPTGADGKRMPSTLAENRREAVNIVKAFGHLDVADMTKSMAYEYLDACVLAGRAQKGNKEIALARLILEHGVRKGVIQVNPFERVRKVESKTVKRLVTTQELALAVEVGRSLGSACHIVALCLKTAWLCVGRSVEARGLTPDAIQADGLLWRDGKDASKSPTFFAWSPDLQATINEALAIRRNPSADGNFVFGNLMGRRYTKSGWASVLDDLMREAERIAALRKIEFKRFSLQDCRPMGVSDKLDRGDSDTQDATRHSSGKMIAATYDRRKIKKATPAG